MTRVLKRTENDTMRWMFMQFSPRSPFSLRVVFLTLAFCAAAYGAPNCAVSQDFLNARLALWQQRLATSCIEEHLAKKISIGSLAALVRLSPSQFCRAFKQSFGVPPHRHHINCRIERAKALLRDYERSVTEIAFMVGFGDASAFSAAFRQSTGETPTAYRRNLD